MPGFVAARALAHAIAVTGSIVVVSNALAADSASSAVVATLNPEVIEPNYAGAPPTYFVIAPSTSLPRPNDLRTDTVITGAASYYDEDAQTSSGEPYDPNAFTAAAQILLRDQFGGIRFGVNYQPSYGVAEYGGRKAIVKFNDVGPLRPGRQFDFSRAVMEYFNGIDVGVLPHVTVTLLPRGRDYTQGPVSDAILASLEAPVVDAQPVDPEGEITTASILAPRESKCDAGLLESVAIDLDAILTVLVVHGADAGDDIIAQMQRTTTQDETPNDLGLVKKVANLP